MTRRSVIVAALAVAGAAIAGERVDACLDRCEERFAECESIAETKWDDCRREIAGGEECGCDVEGARVNTPKCAATCGKLEKARAKCDAKREKRLEKCEDKQLRCHDACESR